MINAAEGATEETRNMVSECVFEFNAVKKHVAIMNTSGMKIVKKPNRAIILKRRFWTVFLFLVTAPDKRIEEC